MTQVMMELNAENLEEVRQCYARREPWKCIEKCGEIFFAKNEDDADKNSSPPKEIDVNCKILSAFIDGQNLKDLCKDEIYQEALYYLGVSFLRLGRCVEQARKIFELIIEGPFSLLADDYYLGACNFVKDCMTNTEVLSKAQKSNLNIRCLKSDWYQYSGNIVVCVYGKEISGESFKVKVESRSISVFIASCDEQYYLYDFPFLSHEINEDSLQMCAYSNKVELKVSKVDAGISWNQLQLYGNDARKVLCDPEDVNKRKDAPPPPLYNKNASWEQELKKLASDELQNDDSLETMFRKIYENSSDDAKRAMLKSYYESSGTCLSTNWNEVSKKRVGVVPPEGTECKKFNN